jgi:AraC-like DNA-binding protein
MIQGIALRSILFCIKNGDKGLIDLLKDADISIEELYKIETTISENQLGIFLEKMTTLLGDERIGLRTGFESPFSTLGILGQLYQSCKTYAEALENMKKHIGLIDSVNEYDFEIRADGIYHITRVNALWAARYPNAARQMVEHNIGFSIRSRREYLGREVKPVAIHTPYSKIGTVDEVEQYFDCPVLFGADALYIVLPLEMLQWPIPTANPEAFKMYEIYIDRLRGERNMWVAHTKQHISQQLQHTAPQLALVASLMNLAPRTLQRRLEVEGYTFQQVLDDVRLEMCKRLLVQPHLSMMEIADAVSFESQASLNRFLRKKLGKAPSEWRKEMIDK